MGVVYRTRQTSLNRTVALKRIVAGELASAADVERFKHEAQAAANLDHPNVLPISEVGEHAGRQYFTMKLVPGGSLADRPGPADPRAAAGLVAAVARAVHFAHQRGILHRDLADRTLNPAADPDLAAVALKCLAKDPAARYASAAELADDLDRWLAGQPTRARPPSAARLAARWLRRNAAAVTCVVAVGVTWGLLSGLLGCAIDVSRIDRWRSLRLLIEGESWFNPLGWAYRLQLDPVVRWAVIGAAAAVGLLAAWEWVHAEPAPDPGGPHAREQGRSLRSDRAGPSRT